jgi:hypothetical protein
MEVELLSEVQPRVGADVDAPALRWVCIGAGVRRRSVRQSSKFHQFGGVHRWRLFTGWRYRLRMKGNLTTFIVRQESRLDSHVSAGLWYLRGPELTHKRIIINIGVIHDRGDRSHGS